MTLEQKIFIRNNYPKLSVKDIASSLSLETYPIISFLYDNNMFKQHKEKDRTVYVEDRKTLFQRPKAIYTNNPSPYGIADELFGRNLTKECYSETKMIG